MRYPDPPPRPELAALQHKEALALKAIADLNGARERAGLPRVHLDVVVQAAAASTDRPPVCAGIDVQAAGCVARLRMEVPSVREVVRLLGVFSRAICLTEEIARGGQGGIVRIQEMAPVVDAIRAYLASIPAATSVER
ncbi:MULTISPECIES: hypothetical protein [unclassified Pseudomonas]|uniref:hypothetical protein n=1 Tax=unclassified Pseudomonas TaxID=196821 RepID=UPI0007308BD0|nr:MULTISPECIES: hypothetical protein [unclassified Pseudomonas]KSW28436.1 hypothetical protein AOX63_00080 [Pseudomonas sp. ADP]OBP09738.1 hypothetical protein BAE52_17770 [Pseudomonas sp. EGD-AKN5]QOF85606.1 hypothetical protein IG194_02535 [Pseudomonas sp. ADPe]